MKMYRTNKKNNQRGYTLLEYCAGAAVIAGVVWTAMQALGGNLSGFINALGGWVADRSADINS